MVDCLLPEPAPMPPPPSTPPLLPLQKTMWALEQVSDCTPSATTACLLADINPYLAMNTSGAEVAAVMSGYPGQAGGC